MTMAEAVLSAPLSSCCRQISSRMEDCLFIILGVKKVHISNGTKFKKNDLQAMNKCNNMLFHSKFPLPKVHKLGGFHTSSSM